MKQHYVLFRNQPVVLIPTLCSAFPQAKQIKFTSTNKLSKTAFQHKVMRLLTTSYLQQHGAQEKQKANLRLSERASAFHPTFLSHKILHLTPCNERERKERAPGSVTIHQGHTKTSSVQLLSTPGWVRLIMKHYRASPSTETNH